ESARAFRDSGMRAAIGLALFDFDDPQRRREEQRTAERVLAGFDVSTTDGRPPRVFPIVAPHSPYTCSPELLTWAADLAQTHSLVYHTHLSETEQEVRDLRAHRGSTPFAWLETLGILEKTGEKTIAAHGIWIEEPELELAARRRMTVVHNPASNMKLASGAFPYAAYRDHGVPLMLAPDGVASNNNLDMFDEMRLAALLQKHHFRDATLLPAEEILSIAGGGRSNVFSDFGIAGELREGSPADLVIVGLTHPQINPVHRIESNLVYAANGSVVDTVICDGEILMRSGEIPEEDEVIREARRCASALVERARR
ncbi:MAG: amidohydrolase family protein, partial [Opitutales bacterium]|nr:amidohydrolase family protein [Opitutales bacterium]